jgi:hypothetical protein
VKSFSFLFTSEILKVGDQKNMRLKGLTCITPINLWFLKIYSTIFVNEFSMKFCLQDLVCLRLLSRNAKFLIEKSLSFIFKIGFVDAKNDFKNFPQIETIKNISLVRFSLTSKFCKH